MKTLWRLVPAGMLVLCSAACSVAPEDQMVWGDLTPPSVLEESFDNDGRLDLTFDEDVELLQESLRASGGARPEVLAGKGRVLSLDTKPGTEPGKPYAVAMSAGDKAGNTTSMVIPFYGDNPRLPRVLISELACKTSTTIRDTVELEVMADGNLAGLTLYLGNPDDNDGFFVFGDIEVVAGNFILVHCKAEGLAEELNESSDWSASGGKNALPGVLDVWLEGAPGLGDASGVVCLFDKPLGHPVDAVFYTDKVSQSGKDYDSFGTKRLLERVRFLEKSGAWLGTAARLAVEDGASSIGMTSTRTLCRQNHADNGNRGDWAVVASGKASLGKTNSSELYVQP